MNRVMNVTERRNAKLPPATEALLKDMLRNVHKTLLLKLNNIEKKVLKVFNRCLLLEQKLSYIALHFVSCQKRSSEVFVGSKYTMNESHYKNDVILLTLNSEADYPDGSWLGDANNPEQRVRSRIIPSDLQMVNENNHTPEKMALTLLDCLFDRETQACSNISGHSKHGKKQLDPLMIYGIYCHIMHHFFVTEDDWFRIKQNLDSKCRTAFRRKLQGLSLKRKGLCDDVIDVKNTLGCVENNIYCSLQGTDATSMALKTTPEVLLSCNSHEMQIDSHESDFSGISTQCVSRHSGSACLNRVKPDDEDEMTVVTNHKFSTDSINDICSRIW